MSKVLVDESSLHGVGNGIRYVNGENTTYKPAQFEAAIKDLKKTLGAKSITENGVFPASGDNLDGYSSVTVDVENTYTAEDEGKVVSGGELAAQESMAATENGTYDTTLKNQVVVNVQPGSGGPAYGNLPNRFAWVAYGNGRFAALADGVSEGGLSADGVTWSEAADFPLDSIFGLAYGNGKFVAAGHDGVRVWIAILRDNATDWEALEDAPFSYQTRASGLIYGNGKFVLFFGDSGNPSNKAAYSADGITWTEVTLPVTWNGPAANGLACKTGLFFAKEYGHSATRCLTSADGVTWTERTITALAGDWVIASSGSRFVALPGSERFPPSGSNAGYYSDDGVTWTAITLPVSGLWDRVEYGGGVFMAVGGQNTPVLLSGDGVNWWTNPPAATGLWDDMAFGASRFVAVSASYQKSMAYRTNLAPLTATANGIYTPPDETEGFSAVRVAVPPSAGTLVEKTITANGEYDPASDNADGYSRVTVNVSAPTLAERLAMTSILDCYLYAGGNRGWAVYPGTAGALGAETFYADIPAAYQNGGYICLTTERPAGATFQFTRNRIGFTDGSEDPMLLPNGETQGITTPPEYYQNSLSYTKNKQFTLCKVPNGMTRVYWQTTQASYRVAGQACYVWLFSGDLLDALGFDWYYTLRNTSTGADEEAVITNRGGS